MSARHAATLPPEYFLGLYAGEPDPWGFASSPYEGAKYAATLESLPRPAYDSALEVGCSIGVFTRALAPRCRALTALDPVPAVLEAARARCADLPGIRFVQGSVPGDWPEGRFDLIVLSEVVYYLDRHDLARLARRVGAALRPGGDCVLVHWLGPTDYPLSGDEAADGFIAEAADFAAVLGQVRDAAYRIDVLRARQAPSAGADAGDA